MKTIVIITALRNVNYRKTEEAQKSTVVMIDIILQN
jgi:hypothetical protein